MVDLKGGERGVERELDLRRERRKLESHHVVMAYLKSPVLACDVRVFRVEGSKVTHRYQLVSVSLRTELLPMSPLSERINF
jgi:hypothetical protein